MFTLTAISSLETYNAKSPVMIFANKIWTMMHKVYKENLS